MKHLLMVATITATFTASPAMAASYSSASLSNFKIELIDLDLEDGNSSSVSFNNPSSSISLSIPFVTKIKSVDDNTSLSESINTDVSASVFRELISNPDIVESTSIFGTGVFFDNLRIEASVNNLNFFNNSVNGTARSSIDYFLSSKSRLIITAEARNHIEIEAGTSGENIFRSASSFAALRANANSSSEDDSASLNAYGIDEPALELSEVSILSVMFDNLTDQQIRSKFTASVGVNGTFTRTTPQTDTPSAVPVPAALPLMASALGLFGFGAIRKKEKNS